MLKALGLEGKRLTIIVRDEDVNAYLSFRNIPKTFIITATRPTPTISSTTTLC